MYTSYFPQGLEKLENLGKSRGILSRLEKFYSKILLKILEKSEKNYTGKAREICQPVIVKTLQIWYHTLNKNRTLKILENDKNTGKVGEIC